MSQGRRSVTMSVDTSGLERALQQLGDDVQAAVRPAAQAAAQVLYEEVKKNVRGINRVTGLLDSSIYQVYSATKSSDGQFATYHVSWNTKRAPHGWLVENGHFRRYQTYRNNDGQIRVMVRPGMENKPKPKRGDSQEYKNRYWVTLPGGPVQVPPKPFVRPAISKFPEARDAAMRKLDEAFKLRSTP